MIDTTRMRTDELKRCPFCGKAQMTDEERGDVIPYRGRPRRCDWCGCTSSQDWNTRPLEDALQDEIQRLRKQIEVMKAWIPAWVFEDDGWDK